MTSGVALETTNRAEQQNPGEMTLNSESYWKPTHHYVTEEKEIPKLGQESRLSKKRPPSSISTPVFKKIRSSVQRTHSPRNLPSPLSMPVSNNVKVQKVTPTVLGIKEVARHLLKPKVLQNPHSLLALPTECTYEVCSVLSWSKKESLSDSETSFRTYQLENLKSVSSCSSVHVYLQHHNINQLLDKLLDFPKKAYATKQNPEVCSYFNESRVIFQRLADQFWPGPVLLYLSPQSFAPDSLLQKSYTNKKYVGFRCPSHPLTVKIIKQVHQEAREPVVLVGSPVQRLESKLLKANDVNAKYSGILAPQNSVIQILQGEEKKEIFAVPTCQFQDEWLECWVVAEKRTIVLKGKSKRGVTGPIKQMLRNSSSKNRVKLSVLKHWKVVDQRGE